MTFMENMEFNAGYWLSLPDHKAFEVFSGAASSIKTSYRRLVQHWHPDRNPDPRAPQVLIRIQQLYRLARKGAPRPSSTVSVVHIKDNNGRVFRYQGHSVQSFELGEVLFANKSFAYHILPSHKNLFDRFIDRVSGFNYATPQMRKSLSPLLPRLAGKVWGPDGGLIVLQRPRDFVSLRHLMEYYAQRNPGSGLPAVHVAWILSGVLNLACYLDHQDLTHNAISPDSVWINPQTHDVSLLGGWFFSHPSGSRIDLLPASSATQASTRFLAEKTADKYFDLALIRALGRELLGDPPGSRLASMGQSPSMIEFLLSAANRSAVEEYRAWKQVLLATFGPPKFVPMNITSKDIYKENDNG